jgi:hypothetical protein
VWLVVNYIEPMIILSTVNVVQSLPDTSPNSFIALIVTHLIMEYIERGIWVTVEVYKRDEV